MLGHSCLESRVSAIDSGKQNRKFSVCEGGTTKDHLQGVSPGVGVGSWGQKPLVLFGRNKNLPWRTGRKRRRETEGIQEPHCVIRSRTESRSPSGMVVVSGCTGVAYFFHLLGHEGTQSPRANRMPLLSGCRTYSIGLAASPVTYKGWQVNVTLSEKCLGT